MRLAICMTTAIHHLKAMVTFKKPTTNNSHAVGAKYVTLIHFKIGILSSRLVSRACYSESNRIVVNVYVTITVS